MTNKNDTLTFEQYPAIKYHMREQGDYLTGSDLEPMFVFSAFGALTFHIIFAQKQLPTKVFKKLNKKLTSIDIRKLTFAHHDKHIEKMVENAAKCALAVCKFHNEPIRYVTVTAIGNYSRYQKDEGIRFPVSRKQFGDFLTVVEEFTCKLRDDGSVAINYVKLKSGEEFALESNAGPFYMDGVTLTAANLRMFKDMITKYRFTQVDAI